MTLNEIVILIINNQFAKSYNNLKIISFRLKAQ